MNLSIQTRSGRSLGTIDLPETATYTDLQSAFHTIHPQYPPSRQRFYLPNPPSSQTRPKPLRDTDDKPLTSLGIQSGSTLQFRDLGAQVSWKTVFILEYLGPLIIYPILYLQPSWIYSSSIKQETDSWTNEVQLLALVAWVFHYMKRELETLFIHRFSHATMPWKNLIKNCMYYWGAAFAVAYFVNHPLYTPPAKDLVSSGLCLFFFMQLGNFICHWTLRNLRPPGTKIRRIPHGGLFEYVSCPNYTYEITAWLGFNLMTKTVAGIVFMCMGAAQMIIWAKIKHRNYKKEFNGQDGKELYPPRRKCIVPFIY